MKFGLFTISKSLLVSEPEIITKGVIAYQRALPPQSNPLAASPTSLAIPEDSSAPQRRAGGKHAARMYATNQPQARP
jgi:hypothetical protein